MDARLTNLPTRELIERLATSDPIPGGGSASALAGAMGAALVHMVVALTANRPAAAGNEEILAEIGSEAVAAQSELLRLAERIIERIRELANDSNRPITLYINSAGGNVTDGLAIHDSIRALVARGVEVTIVVQGMAYSMGSVVLQAASERRRLSLPHSWIMIHEPAKWAGWTIDILGTDVSTGCIERARQGIYSQFEVQRGLGINQMIKWFEECPDGWRAVEPLRKLRVRLEDKEAIAALHQFVTHLERMRRAKRRPAAPIVARSAEWYICAIAAA